LIERIKGHSRKQCPVDAIAAARRQGACSAAAECWIATVCFHDVILERREERRRFKTKHGRKLLLGGAREGMTASGTTGQQHTAWKRTKSPAGVDRAGALAGALLADADAGSSSLRRGAQSSLVAAAGRSGSTPARVPTAASYVRADDASARPRAARLRARARKAERASLPIRADLGRTCSIQRSGAPQGWTVFHLPSTPGRPDGR